MKNLLPFIICWSIFTASGVFAFEGENNYDELIKVSAARYSLDPDYIKAVIWQESKFNPAAVGDAGEVGLMQITHAAVTDWAKQYNVRIPSRRLQFEPNVNIEIGVWYLAKAIRYWQSYRYKEALALCEYNAGRRGMKNWIPKTSDGFLNISSKLTRNYVVNILKRFQHYRDNGSLNRTNNIAYNDPRRY